MLERSVDIISNWNPQLIRELKSRLDRSSLMIVTAISLCAQSIPFILIDRTSQPNTPLWWLSIFEILDRELWFSLAFGGIYLLIADFDREIRSGTLDIVNLAPLQPLEILLGKLLGVPILIYWAVFLALPLYIISADRIAAIAPHAWVKDLIALTEIGLLYLYALLSPMRFPLPPIVMSIALTIAGWLGLFTINFFYFARNRIDNYSDLGIYLAEDWWVVWKVTIVFAVSYIVLLMLLKNWYPTSKLDRSKQSLAPILLYLFSLLLPILIAGSQPAGMLLFTIIGFNIIIKAEKVT
jgi:hypothetical protein